MATATVSTQGIQWQSLDGGGDNLVAVFAFDFGVFDQYTVNATGVYLAGKTVIAQGIVIDNLDNPNMVTITAGAVIERVAPFSKSPLRLWNRVSAVGFMASGGFVRASFFTGLFPGALQGANVYGAVKSAKL